MQLCVLALHLKVCCFDCTSELMATVTGIFRQHMIYKGRNRDSAWLSITDGEWPDRRSRFERWLHPSNFDADGRQIKRLTEI